MRLRCEIARQDLGLGYCCQSGGGLLRLASGQKRNKPPEGRILGGLSFVSQDRGAYPLVIRAETCWRLAHVARPPYLSA